MGVDYAILDATGHIAVGVIRVCVRRSRFPKGDAIGADAGHRMRDARAVGIRPREPAGLSATCVTRSKA